MTTTTIANGQCVSFRRQLDIFSPAEFKTTCHVVGVGAVGSRVAETLTRIGVPRLELWDHDAVQPHNVPTGVFDRNHVGMPKVVSVQQKLKCFPDTTIATHEVAVGTEVQFAGVVFVCVDLMSTRRLIWEKCIRLRPQVALMIETRIGPLEGRVYTVNPIDSLHIHCWEEVSNYPDGHTEELSCTNRCVATTVGVVAGLAVQQMVNWHRGQNFAHSIVFGLNERPFLRADRWTS